MHVSDSVPRLTALLRSDGVRLGKGRAESASTWSYDSGGSGAGAQRSSWIAFVERSPSCGPSVPSADDPLGYEVWRDSAD